MGASCDPACPFAVISLMGMYVPEIDVDCTHVLTAHSPPAHPSSQSGSRRPRRNVTLCCVRAIPRLTSVSENHGSSDVRRRRHLGSGRSTAIFGTRGKGQSPSPVSRCMRRPLAIHPRRQTWGAPRPAPGQGPVVCIGQQGPGSGARHPGAGVAFRDGRQRHVGTSQGHTDRRQGLHASRRTARQAG